MSDYFCGTCGRAEAFCKCTAIDHALRSTVAERRPPKMIVESTPPFDGKPLFMDKDIPARNKRELEPLPQDGHEFREPIEESVGRSR